MFWIKTIIAFAIISLVLFIGSMLERHFASLPSPRPGLLLPALATIVAIALAVPNFVQSLAYPISPLAFGASVALFVFYMIPAAVFFLLYIEIRRDLTERAKRRTEAGRETRRRVVRERMEPTMPEHYASKMRPTDIRSARRPSERPTPRSESGPNARPNDRSANRPPRRSPERPPNRPNDRGRR